MTHTTYPASSGSASPDSDLFLQTFLDRSFILVNDYRSHLLPGYRAMNPAESVAVSGRAQLAQRGIAQVGVPVLGFDRIRQPGRGAQLGGVRLELSLLSRQTVYRLWSGPTSRWIALERQVRTSSDQGTMPM